MANPRELQSTPRLVASANPARVLRCLRTSTAARQQRVRHPAVRKSRAARFWHPVGLSRPHDEALESWQHEYGIEISPNLSCWGVQRVDRFALPLAQRGGLGGCNASAVRAAIRPWSVAGHTLHPSTSASDPVIRNLGVTWSTRTGCLPPSRGHAARQSRSRNAADLAHGD
jgi:hypothetical protein